MYVKNFLENPIFLASISSWFMAQLVKVAIGLLSHRRKNLRELVAIVMWRTGGMPSSHASVVSSMTTSLAFQEGVGSNLFIVSFFLAMVVLRDAMGVRRASGIQAKVLNQLGRNVSEKLGLEYRPVKEVNGHTPLEVAVGVLLGVFIATAYALL
ncbi:MAG: divergent PAP2 family protein [Treponema sp.]|nr:divergent PAP2 family protein [Treponema sp.]